MRQHGRTDDVNNCCRPIHLGGNAWDTGGGVVTASANVNLTRDACGACSCSSKSVWRGQLVNTATDSAAVQPTARSWQFSSRLYEDAFYGVADRRNHYVFSCWRAYTSIRNYINKDILRWAYLATGIQQEVQLSQSDRAVLYVVEYFAESLKVIQDHSK